MKERKSVAVSGWGAEERLEKGRSSFTLSPECARMRHIKHGWGYFLNSHEMMPNLQECHWECFDYCIVGTLQIGEYSDRRLNRRKGRSAAYCREMTSYFIALAFSFYLRKWQNLQLCLSCLLYFFYYYFPFFSNF